MVLKIFSLAVLQHGTSILRADLIASFVCKSLTPVTDQSAVWLADMFSVIRWQSSASHNQQPSVTPEDSLPLLYLTTASPASLWKELYSLWALGNLSLKS